MISHIGLFLGLGCALFISWEDFRTRYISWLPLIGLFLSGIITHIGEISYFWFVNMGLNLGFIILILSVLFLYLKSKGAKQIMDIYLGWGDVVMMLALTTWFPSEQYVFWYLASTILALLSTFLMMRFRNKEKDYPIPFAGYMGVCFIFFQLAF